MQTRLVLRTARGMLPVLAAFAGLLSQPVHATAQSVAELLQSRTLTIQHTDCHVKSTDKFVTLTVQVRLAGGSLSLQGAGAPGAYSPYSVTKSYTVSGNTLSWDGGSDAITLSEGGSQCSYRMTCPATHPVGRAISCTVNGGSNQQVAAAPTQNDKSTEPLQAARPSRPDAGSSAAGKPQLVRGLTRQQCSARGGRITTFTNTAGRGPDVGECLVPPRMPDSASLAPAQRSAPASAQGPTPSQSEPVDANQPQPAPVVASAPDPLRQIPGGSTPEAGASGPGAPSSPSDTSRGVPYKPTLRKEDCDTASPLDRSTYAWYEICVPDASAGTAQRTEQASPFRKPPISPQDLSAQATAACRDAASEAQRRCVEDAKVNILLAKDSDVRDACASIVDRDSKVACADAVYLYGRNSLRLLLERSLRNADSASEPGTAWHPKPKPQDTVDGCPLGQGMKPTHGAFGAYSCQPLFGTGRGADNKAANSASANSPDLVQELEARVDRISALVVAATAQTAVAPSSEKDRNACLDEAYAAVRSLLKGGAPRVSSNCKAMANAARAEFAYYASNHIDTTNAGMEDLLAVLTIRNSKNGPSISGNLGPPAPGMTGLEPIAANRPQLVSPAADCTPAETHWKSAEDIKMLAIYEDHLARFPNCAFATLAKARIEALKRR